MDFLRPPDDNGIGFHFDLDVRADKLNAHLPILADMHVKWVVFFVQDELQALNCAAAANKFGMMPIIRPDWKFDGAMPNWEVYVQRVLSVCPAAYIQAGNEPGDPREWRGKPNRGVYVARWRDAAVRIAGAGGYPGLQTLDEIDVKDIFTGWAAPTSTWFASHAYASNHPPNYPYDKGQTVFQDDTCALRWIEEAEWCKKYIGYYPPVIVTEGGYVMDQQEDNTYPRIDANLHAKYSVALFDQFRGTLANGDPLPDHFFAYCPFLFYDPDYYSFSWLQAAPQSIAVVKAMPVFVRGKVTPPPPPPPPPPIPPPAWTGKLGVYVTAQGFAGIERWNPRVVVTMNLDRNFITGLKQSGTFVVGRVFFDDQRFDGNYWADFMLPKLNGLAGLLDAVMAINEPAVYSVEDAVNLQMQTKIWSDRMHAAGFKTGAYSFSEGHPDLGFWQYLANHGCDYLFLHEYDAPEMWRTQGWRCLRYRHAEIPKNVPVVITETGIDGGVSGVDKPQQGWKSFGNVDHYIESLRWYRDELAKDSYVIGAAIFAGNWNVGNGSFNIENEEKIRLLLTENTPVPPPPSPPPPATWDAICDRQYGASDVNAIGIAALALSVGFTIDQAKLVTQILLVESNGGNPRALGKNPDGSVDRGLVQWNSKWHGDDVSDDCAANPRCAMLNMYIVFKADGNFHQWVAYTSGAYKKYQLIAERALAALGK